MNNLRKNRSLCAVTMAAALLLHAGCSSMGAPAGASAATGARQTIAPAEWTIMVYLNGDNNLEPFAVQDFAEMARVGSTEKVNIIVQFDRSGKYDQSAVQWSQTLRFRVTRGMRGTPAEALEDLGEVNMGDGATLRQFVEWSREKFPARRYMLTIWDHGQGWRAVQPAGTEADSPTLRASPFKAVSHDESSHDQLYNSEAAEALRAALRGQKLDVLGFDACLMAMIETGYAFRDTAKVLVGSEELEPGDGWPYDVWLKELTLRPELPTEQLAAKIVDAYRADYSAGIHLDPDTTQSAVRLDGMEQMAMRVAALAQSLKAHLGTELVLIRGARQACSVYAPNSFGDGLDYFHHLDLVKFCDELLARTQQPATPAQREIRERASAVRNAVSASVLANYAGASRRGAYGSNGLAIYFPATGTLYTRDRFAEGGYEKSNTRYPVEFVNKTAWTDFLHAYYQQVR